MTKRFRFDAEVWEYEGPAAWFFVSLPHDVADEIDEAYQGRTNGFGSIRVEVKVGSSKWLTSIFPDRKRATFVLPVKKEVRRAEGLEAGTVAKVDLRTLD
ncbi:MAG TPA: DUF1905 domain-containing protein [Acidimicrobiales bacterium]|nr:DUF1905 domain-containing protein [Acidimicrobiales bacterium]